MVLVETLFPHLPKSALLSFCCDVHFGFGLVVVYLMASIRLIRVLQEFLPSPRFQSRCSFASLSAVILLKVAICQAVCL